MKSSYTIRGIGFLICLMITSGMFIQIQGAEHLIPARFTYITDNLGFRWDLSGAGMIKDGSNDCFDGGFALKVNNMQFSSRNSMMTHNGDEYVLSTHMGGLEITRRIRIDKQQGIVRYLEIVKNTSGSPKQVQLSVASQLGGSCASFISDKGRPGPATLDKKESGILALNTGGRRPSVLFCMATPFNKNKPTVTFQQRRSIKYTYSYSIKAGENAAILHTAAQRNYGTVPGQKILAEEYKKLKSYKWLNTVPKLYRKQILNWGGSFSFSGEMPAIWVIQKHLGISQAKTDILAEGSGSRLHGTVTGKEIVIKNRFGKAKIPLERIAALTGKRFGLRNPRVYLRNGEIISGDLTAENLRFTMDIGMSIKVSPDNLDRLIMHADKQTKKDFPEKSALLETLDGDRLLLEYEGSKKVKFITCWGTKEIGVNEIMLLQASDETFLGHSLTMKNGTRLFGLLQDPRMMLKSSRFGLIEIEAGEVVNLSILKKPDKETDVKKQDKPYVVLKAENILIGTVDEDELTFALDKKTISVPPVHIKQMVRSEREDDISVECAKNPVYKVELWDGSTFVARIFERRLPIRSDETVWNIPVHDVMEIFVPAPVISDSLRSKIAKYIRDLGHPDWEQREKATEDLRGLGVLAKSQLIDIIRNTNDPEVKRRAEAILKEIRE